MLKFKIGIQTSTSVDYEFDENYVITLSVIKQYNLNVNKRGEKKYTIVFLHENNSIIKNKQIKILNNNPDTILNKKKELCNEYGNNIIKDQIQRTALEISIMSDEELSYFSYNVPNPIIYEPIDLPIDPYYVGFWLGDGTSSLPGNFTCDDGSNSGCNDQKYILPFMKKFAKSLDLEFKSVKDKKKPTITFAMNRGINISDKDKLTKRKTNSKTTISSNNCFNNDWLENVISDCKKLEISKKSHTSYDNFQNQYDPYKKYLQEDGNYKCHCNYTTSKIKGRQSYSLQKSRQYSMRDHLKTHKISLLNSNKVWKGMSTDDQLKWKVCDNKKDICRDSKYLCWVTLWEMYDIYEEKGEKGIEEYQQEMIKRCNPLNYWFHKLKLTDNKHIPDIYLKASIEDRKKLLAGLIDSDGTSGGKSKNNHCWDIGQKLKIITDGIEILAKSLGMFTRRSEKQCRAKYPDGTYSEYSISYRIIIHPYNNWDIPVLLERKKIETKPHNEDIGTTYLRIKNINTEIKNNTELSDKLKIILYSVVHRFKELQKDTPIPWSILSKLDKRLFNINTNAMITTYEKIYEDKEEYDKKIIKLDFIIPIDKKFLENYNKIKQIILDDNEEFNDKSQSDLYNWFNTWLYNKEYKDELKKNMIKGLYDLLKKQKDNKTIENFKVFLNDLQIYIDQNKKKPPQQSTKLGDKLKQYNDYYNKKKGSVWNNIKIRKLWEDFNVKNYNILNKKRNK